MESLSQVVSRVIDDAKGVARAELDLVKARALGKVAGYRTAVALFAVAAVLALAAVFGLIVGLIFTFTPALGPGWATAVVVLATLIVAGLLGWLGAHRAGGA